MSYTLQLEGTTACALRDKLKEAFYQKKITLKEITDKLCKIVLPEWLQAEILQMVSHNQYKRCTCPIEQCMEKAVHYFILKQILDEEK